MKNKPFQIALLYSTIYIAALCLAFYGHYEQHLSKVYMIGMAAILPLVILTIKMQRDNVFGGVISGKAAAKEGMKFVLWSALFLGIFQVIFFYAGFHDYKIDFTRIAGLRYYAEENEKLVKLGKAKLSDIEIQNKINLAVTEITVFKELTGVFFRVIIFGLFSSFLGAIFLKKNS